MANYRVPVLEQFSWQPPVMSGSLTAPPGSPVKGDRYIVADPATGDWLGQEDKIATYTGSGWLFDAPVNNWVVFVDDAEKALRYDGSATHWVDLTTAPRSHHSTHEFAGSDAIKLDALDTPDDTTTLDATTSRHGLLPKLGGGTTNFLRADGTWVAPPTPSTPTGTGFRHVTSGVEDAASKLVENADVAAAAGIAESKLSLNYATHSPANDPTADQKAALAGTSGTPGAANKYVTDQDGRLPTYDASYKCLMFEI